MNGLVKGRMVWYTSTEGDVHQSQKTAAGHTVAAIVVNVCDKELGVVDLTLFPNGSADGFLGVDRAIPYPVFIAHREAVEYSEESSAGTWRWPERE